MGHVFRELVLQHYSLMLRSRFDLLMMNSPPGRGWGWVADEKDAAHDETHPLPLPGGELSVTLRNISYSAT